MALPVRAIVGCIRLMARDWMWLSGQYYVPIFMLGIGFDSSFNEKHV